MSKYPELEADIIAAGANVAPRTTQVDVDENIVLTEIVKHVTPNGKVLRWAVLTCRNGFAVTGKPSASFSVENDREAIGIKIAIDNAKNSLWDLMAYAMAEKMAGGASALSAVADGAEKLLPYQQRVVAEKSELDEKISKLVKFMASDAYKAMPHDDALLLTVQYESMYDYSEALGQRIQRFQASNAAASDTLNVKP